MVQSYTVDSNLTDTHKRVAAQIDQHRQSLEKDYQQKSDLWNAAMTKHQTAADSLRKAEQRSNDHKRKTGQTCYNPDGSLAFLGGFSGESHLRTQPEILRELSRYCLNDMLRLRQNKIESLLHEVIETAENELLVGRYELNSPEYQHLRQNVWSIRTALGQISRRNGVPPSKAFIVRTIVSTIIY